MYVPRGREAEAEAGTPPVTVRRLSQALCVCVCVSACCYEGCSTLKLSVMTQARLTAAPTPVVTILKLENYGGGTPLVLSLEAACRVE